MGRFSDAERAAILERSRELLSRDLTETRQVSEPEISREEILQDALAQPLETTNQRHRREIVERNARWAAQRDLETMAGLEARLRRLIADERDAIYKAVSKVFAKFCGPYEKRLAELQEKIDGMKGRDGVSVTAAHVNRNGELMLTLSDGTVLTPGPVGELKQERGETEPIVDLPNPVAVRRWQ